MVELEHQLFQHQAWTLTSLSRKRESGAENALVVREKTTVVNVHLVEMIRVIKFVNNVVVSV